MKMSRFLLIISILFFSNCASRTDSDQIKPNNAKYINPFICTADDHGQTDVAAAVPFGAVKPGPDTYPLGHSGYDFNSKEIIGFSHTRFSGVGCRGVGGNIRILPCLNADSIPAKSSYIKESEIAEAGFYSVLLEDNIRVELTATNNVAFHRYTFPASDESCLSLDLSSSFVAGISESHNLDKNGILSGKVESVNVCKKGKYSFYYAFYLAKDEYEITEDGSRVEYRFKTEPNEKINAYCAISVISTEKARENLIEQITYSFEEVRKEAYDQWNQLVNVVQVETDDESAKQLFYTHLYHATQSPFLISEEDGSYRGSDGKVYEGKLKKYYHGWSIWDTFRSKLPLLSFLYPRQYKDMLASLAELYKQGKPDWATETEPFITIRTEHTIPVLLDAHRKGMLPFSLEEIYLYLKDEAENLSYLSPDNILESSFDLWALSEIARDLGYSAEADNYLSRAMEYKPLWKEKFMNMGETADIMHGDGLYEGTLWQYRWFVPFDIKGIQDLIGGKDVFEEQLDYFFSNELFNIGNQPDIQVPYLYAYTNSPWKTQQLVHSLLNEETNNWYGTHEKWDKPLTRKIFRNSPDGYIKEMDDDAGTMSAWYIWSAMGFYPVFPGSTQLVITTPQFDKISINLPDRKLEIEIVKPTKESIFIQKVEIDGKNHNSCFIDFNQLIKVGKMKIYLAEHPNKNWGI